MNYLLEPTNAMITELPDLLIEVQSDLPEGWVWKKLGEIAQIKTGKKDTQNKVDHGEYPFFVRSQTVERINSYSFDGEAILTAGDGVGVGKVFHYVNGRFDFHQRVYRISDFVEGVNGKFIFKYFSQNFFREVTKYTAKSSVDSVRLEMIAAMPIPLPPLVEQQRIATILNKWDEGIEKLQSIIIKTKQRKAGLMQQLLVGNKRFTEFNGQAWETARLGDVFSFIRNESHSRDCLTYQETENQIYYVHYGDIHATFETSILNFGKEARIPQLKDKVVLSKQSAFLQDGDLIIADASEDYEGVGKYLSRINAHII